MAYVRKKRGTGWDYYQLVESRRVNGKPRQKVLLHLGRHATVEEALKKWPREIKKLRRDAAKEREGVPESYDADWGMKTLYRNRLKIAHSLEEQAVHLEEKLGRLRSFQNTGLMPSKDGHEETMIDPTMVSSSTGWQDPYSPFA